MKRRPRPRGGDKRPVPVALDPAVLTGVTGGTPPDPYIGEQHNETAVRAPRRTRRHRAGRRS